MAQETPKVDPVSKLVTFIGVILLLVTVLYMVQSFLTVVDENTTKGPTVQTPDVAEAQRDEAEAEKEAAETEAAETEEVAAAAEETAAEAEAEEAAAEATETAVADAAKGGEHYQANCASCHGMNAEGQGSFPKLAGMSFEEVDASLKAYRAGEKTGGQAAMMAPMATGLSDEQIANLAAHIAEVGGQDVPGGAAKADDAVDESSAETKEEEPAADESAASGDVAAGQQKYQAQCASCHGMQGEGQGMFPKLAGHSAEEIVADLKAYKAGEKTGANAAMMVPMAAGLSDADMADLGAFISGL
ncbi:MAG: c-type cytochrome [Halothiobacillaceae bacterium]